MKLPFGMRIFEQKGGIFVVELCMYSMNYKLEIPKGQIVTSRNHGNRKTLEFEI